MRLLTTLLALTPLLVAVPQFDALATESPSEQAAAVQHAAPDDTVLSHEDSAIAGSGKGSSFTKKTKQIVKQENAARNEGKNRCENCGVETADPQQHKKGVTPPSNETQVDHVTPRAKGGEGVPENGQVLCRDCNIKKSDKAP